MKIDPLTIKWLPEQTIVMQNLHDWAVSSAELSQHLAAWLDLPGSDANALGHIIWSAEEGHPLSPADLSRRISMTTGATTVLLHRLERAGHIRRSREHTDRRRVTLRPEEATRERARAFMAAAGAEIAQVILSTPIEELRSVATFAARLTAASSKANKRLQNLRTVPSSFGT